MMYRCGGYADYYGHCGALDCETCHPGGAAALAREEMLERLQEELEPLYAELRELEDIMFAAHELLFDTSGLREEYQEIEEEIAEIENRADGPYVI